MSTDSAETRELERAARRPGRPGRPGPILLNTGAVLDGAYEILRPIGQGGMGRVVEVVRLADRRHLALKYSTGKALGQRRLVREARILGTLRHPHLLRVLGANLDHDPPYFLMPLAVETLEAERARRGGEARWAIRVFRQVALGVRALHDAGVVHRDLKPSNVLRMPDGRHVVADLGAAKREPRDSTILTRTCAILGTLSYLAPEQLMPGGSRQADARTDIYQLGKMLYELASGRNPVVVEPDRLPAGLARIVRRATAPRPADRYGRVEDLLDAVERCAEAADEQGREATPPGPSRTLAELGRLARNPCGDRRAAEEVLDVLVDLDRLPDEVALDAFDRLPVALLGDLGRQCPARLVERLRAQARRLDRAASRRGFAYADLVARRMRELADACPSPDVLAHATEAALVAAVALNRYSAMAVVRGLLYRAQDAEAALAVAEMLRERRDEFQEIAPFLRPERMHSLLRAVINDLDWIETVTF